MKSLVIKPKNQEELEFISSLLKKLRISTKLLLQDEIEDLGLSILMKETDRSKKVSRNLIIKKLER
jgi:hypothetical protein